MKQILLCVAVLLTGCAAIDTASLHRACVDSVIALPAPRMDGGMPLMQALKQRSTSRDFSGRALPLALVSDLLWAANGINRPESGKRTAPSAMNWQETDIYLVTADGVYLYQPKPHALLLVTTNDLRAATGGQEFVKDAPVNLVYVADLAKVNSPHADMKESLVGMDAAFVSQNVYLFCASEGLATVVRGSVDKEKLAGLLGLHADQRVTLAQTVGYRK